MYYFMMKDGVCMNSGWDFIIDSKNQEELASELTEKAASYRGRIDDLYGEINGMGKDDEWSGDDYDIFQANTTQYKTPIEEVAKVMDTFSSHLNKMSNRTNDLTDELIEIVNNMAKLD